MTTAKKTTAATQKPETSEPKAPAADNGNDSAAAAPAPASTAKAAEPKAPAAEKKPAKKPEPKDVPALFVKSKPKTFCRAGHKFNEHGYGIALSALTKDQIQAIKAEPMLIVEECTIPAESIVESAE